MRYVLCWGPFVVKGKCSIYASPVTGMGQSRVDACKRKREGEAWDGVRKIVA